MQILHKVYLEGVFLGWVSYGTAADLWSDAAYATREDFADSKPIGSWTCDTEDHEYVEVEVKHRDESPSFTMQWCNACRCLVSPPFDGYAYHDYGCDMESSCKCDVV
jgi:hypothetical protein